MYNVDATDKIVFTTSLTERAKEVGWDIEGVGITSIMLNPSDPNLEYKNILTNYGELTIEQVREFEETYILLDNRAV